MICEKQKIVGEPRFYKGIFMMLGLAWIKP